jgi:hypothetical protein
LLHENLTKFWNPVIQLGLDVSRLRPEGGFMVEDCIDLSWRVIGVIGILQYDVKL